MSTAEAVFFFSALYTGSCDAEMYAMPNKIMQVDFQINIKVKIWTAIWYSLL